MLATTACTPKVRPLEPNVVYTPSKQQVASLPGPFQPLLPFEKRQEWSREYLIALAFGKELDLYRAITTFKRAKVLLPDDATDRRQQIDYDIALCYYLGGKYSQVIDTIEETSLGQTTPDFPAYQELLLIAYEAYEARGRSMEAAAVLNRLHDVDSGAADDLTLSRALRRGDLATIQRCGVTDFSREYRSKAKSIGTAQALSVVPGLGYLYVGQTQTAITAFLLNALFIVGSWQLFQRGLWPVGIFTTSLEMGWYLGGIYGAGEAAKLYNERLYERLVRPTICERKLFPVLMLRWGF